MPAFVLSSRSLANLDGVHPTLVKLVQTAISLTAQDFAVFEGLRTSARQREYVARGVSRTPDSMHLRQPDGFGHAVDLVPWIDGGLRWEWPAIYPIAYAMHEAVRRMTPTPHVVWGGVWDRNFAKLELTGDLRAHVSAYCFRHPGLDFLDGPHFELHI